MPLWPVMALMALMAYGLWQDQCDYYWYPVKEHWKTNSPVLFPPHYDNLLKSYSCLKFSSWSLHCEPHCKNGLGAKKLSTWFPMLKSWKPKHVFFRKWSKKKESNPGHLILRFLFHSVSIYWSGGHNFFWGCKSHSMTLMLGKHSPNTCSSRTLFISL